MMAIIDNRKSSGVTTPRDCGRGGEKHRGSTPRPQSPARVPLLFTGCLLLLAAISVSRRRCGLAMPTRKNRPPLRPPSIAWRAAVVQIETVGGEEKVEGLLFGTGPTTGLAVDPRGYIISSAFNFVNKPTSILVRLADGQRKSARLVATDHSRMVVLLKIEVDKPLPVCEIAPQREMRVGQWAIAVGRTFESDRPNMAVGILSAVERIWGKALQTDAAVSPNNYGGPLVDVRGRVMGILVPLSPDATGGVAGMEWYDSGIGFAIPMEHIRAGLAAVGKRRRPASRRRRRHPEGPQPLHRPGDRRRVPSEMPRHHRRHQGRRPDR